MSSELAPESPATIPTGILEPPDTGWPRVIGIISIIYAICGLGCQVLGLASIFLTEWLMSLGGMDVEMPAMVKITTGATAVVMTGVGFLMLAGGIALVRRRRTGVSRLRLWAILRMVLIAVGVVVGLMTAPAQLQFQEQALEATNQMLREKGQTAGIREFDEDAAWTQQMIMVGVLSAAFSAYPLFLGFFLSRRKITDEVATWD